MIRGFYAKVYFDCNIHRFSSTLVPALVACILRSRLTRVLPFLFHSSLEHVRKIYSHTSAMTGLNDERQKLIDSKPNSYDSGSRLEWAESSWTRCLYLWCWWWINPVLSKGYKQSLTDNDLDSLPHDDQTSVLLNRLESYDWSTTTTWKIIVKVFWKEYMSTALLCLPFLIVRIAQPLLLRQLIINITNYEKSLLSIYIFAVLLSLCIPIQAVLEHQIHFRSIRIGIRVRSVLISSIFARSLSMKFAAWQHTDSSKILNLMSIYACEFEEICSRFHVLLRKHL